MKILKIIARKLIISNFNKIKSLLNDSKAWQTVFPAGSLKEREPSKKYPKENLSQVTEVDEPKTSKKSKVKRTRWSNFIVKFEI